MPQHEDAQPRPSPLRIATDKALGGGIAGIGAQLVQVGSLMWLHTVLNHQYKTGNSLSGSLRVLWAEGGVRRLYRGLPFALILAPSTRFIDTAANAGCMSLLGELEGTGHLPVVVKTLCGSVVASVARLSLLPLDIAKTVMQVEGVAGLPLLRRKVAALGPRALFHGGAAATTSSIISHYPWFVVYNTLDGALPEFDTVGQSVVRNAGIGLSAATAAACVSNWTRVIKTTKQTHATGVVSYHQIVTKLLATDGLLSLVSRGLGTKILINGIQSAMFTVLFKLAQSAYFDQPQRPLATDMGKSSRQ